jgi:nitroreductase
MTSVIERAKRVYREEGSRSFLRKGWKFILQKFFIHVAWNVLPKNETLRFISRSRVLTTLYFFLTGTFYPEQRAVLCGLAEYHELEEQRGAPRHRIIRNVHRIEKGLSMRNRRSVFAESYIREVVDDLITAWDPEENDEQLRWAVDVVGKYFEVVDPTKPISKAESEFTEFLSEIEYSPENRVPFPRRDLADKPVSPEAMEELAVRRTSTRWFEQRTVPREEVDKALQVAMQSPSACNRQSYEYRLYDDPELIDEISSLAIGASGYKDNIPCLAVIVGKQRAYFNDRDKHVIYIDASLSAMAFQFALETRGLASCCINWPAIPRNEKEMEEILNLDCDESVVMLMAIGYPDPDGMVPYSEKKEVTSVRSYNKT